MRNNFAGLLLTRPAVSFAVAGNACRRQVSDLISSVSVFPPVLKWQAIAYIRVEWPFRAKASSLPTRTRPRRRWLISQPIKATPSSATQPRSGSNWSTAAPATRCVARATCLPSLVPPPGLRPPRARPRHDFYRRRPRRRRHPLCDPNLGTLLYRRRVGGRDRPHVRWLRQQLPPHEATGIMLFVS